MTSFSIQDRCIHSFSSILSPNPNQLGSGSFFVRLASNFFVQSRSLSTVRVWSPWRCSPARAHGSAGVFYGGGAELQHSPRWWMAMGRRNHVGPFPDPPVLFCSRVRFSFRSLTLSIRDRFLSLVLSIRETNTSQTQSTL